jgi:hypothetical protein
MTDEDLNFIGPIAPVKLFSGREGRCGAKLLFGNFKFIGTVFRIVFQRSPWNGKVFLTEAKETAEAQNCIGNLAGQLVDHQALDHADLFARWSADRRTLDAGSGRAGLPRSAFDRRGIGISSANICESPHERREPTVGRPTYPWRIRIDGATRQESLEPSIRKRHWVIYIFVMLDLKLSAICRIPSELV